LGHKALMTISISVGTSTGARLNAYLGGDDNVRVLRNGLSIIGNTSFRRRE